MMKAAIVIERLAAVMGDIAKYDEPRKDGCCQYGCDCPHQAQVALAYTLGVLA